MGFDLQNHTAQPIGHQPWFVILEISWQDDMGSFIMSARDHAAGPFRLWRITYPDGTAQRLTTDLAEYMGFSMSGQDSVTVRSDISWELMVARADAGFENPSTIASGSGLNYGLTWAGNNKIVFSSMVQDKLNISQIDVDGTNQNPLSKDGDNYTPAASRDGRFIVFSSNRNGKSNIWRTNADGSDPKQLTFSDGNYYPSISPDNQWVVYDNQENRQFVTIWKVPLEGGDAVKIIDGYRMPAYSPDNQRIAVRYDEVAGTNEFAIYSAQGGEPLKRVTIPKFDWQRVHWLSNNTVTYIDKVGGYSNIWSYDLDTGAKKQLTSFNRKQIFAYAWSPDYKLLACQLGTTTRNVVLAK
jgi:Tol biopolymer transport system component